MELDYWKYIETHHQSIDDPSTWSLQDWEDMGVPRGPYIRTVSGRRYHLLDPRPEDFDIEEIAHALSMTNRFTGHCRYPYSVAQHSYYVSFSCDAGDWLWGLLHDASEYVLGDMSSPLKRLNPQYKRIERINQRAICRSFGLCEVEPTNVKAADLRLYLGEREDVMGFQDPDIEFPGVERTRIRIMEWSWRYARDQFLERFEYLSASNTQLRLTP